MLVGLKDINVSEGCLNKSSTESQCYIIFTILCLDDCVSFSLYDATRTLAYFKVKVYGEQQKRLTFDISFVKFPKVKV